MNIKFVEDLKNSQMRVTIKLKKRNLAREERTTLAWHGLKDIVDGQYKCTSTHILGECLNPYQKMDNNYDHLLEKTWIFNLIRKSASATKELKKVPTRKKSTKKTTVKK